MRSEAWPKISLFPLALAALVTIAALAVNIVGPGYNSDSARIAEASQLVTQAREAYARDDWVSTQQLAGRAVALNPSNVTSRLILGLAYMNMNSLDQAEAEFRQVLSVAKDDQNSSAWAHNNLGVVFQRRGRLDLAEREFRTALDLDPSNGQARVNLAMIKRLFP